MLKVSVSQVTKSKISFNILEYTAREHYILCNIELAMSFLKKEGGGAIRHPPPFNILVFSPLPLCNVYLTEILTAYDLARCKGQTPYPSLYYVIYELPPSWA